MAAHLAGAADCLGGLHQAQLVREPGAPGDDGGGSCGGEIDGLVHRPGGAGLMGEAAVGGRRVRRHGGAELRSGGLVHRVLLQRHRQGHRMERRRRQVGPAGLDRHVGRWLQEQCISRPPISDIGSLKP